MAHETSDFESPPLRMTMQATFVSVDEEILRRALQTSEDAREFATELLAVHDDNLGRTTQKNRMWAEQLEKSAAGAKVSIAELRAALRFG